VVVAEPGVAAKVMKNWLPLVLAPALAIERMPGFEWRSLASNSSANLYPGPPVPVTSAHLNHEVLDDAVKHETVVEGAFGFLSVFVSNSLSGRHWEMDQVPAVGDPTHIVQPGKGYRVSPGEGQRREAVQRRVAACCVVVDLEVGKLPFKITGIPEQHLVEQLSPHRPDQGKTATGERNRSGNLTPSAARSRLRSRN
jgi:hypothetical protein